MASNTLVIQKQTFFGKFGLYPLKLKQPVFSIAVSGKKFLDENLR